jgi:hypothetical protein
MASLFLFFPRLIGSPPGQTLIALSDFKHRAMGDGVKDHLCGEPASVLAALNPVLRVAKVVPSHSRTADSIATPNDGTALIAFPAAH